MNIKQRLFIRNKKKELINKWYKLVKPLGNYLSQREEKRYQKMKANITEEQAIKWFARIIIDYIIRYPKETFPLVIATWINDEYHCGYYCIGDHSFTRLLRKKKYRTAFYKFNKDINFQEKVIDILKNKKGIIIKEKIEEFNFRKPENYRKTYFIKLEN